MLAELRVLAAASPQGQPVATLVSGTWPEHRLPRTPRQTGFIFVPPDHSAPVSPTLLGPPGLAAHTLKTMSPSPLGPCFSLDSLIRKMIFCGICTTLLESFVAGGRTRQLTQLGKKQSPLAKGYKATLPMVGPACRLGLHGGRCPVPVPAWESRAWKPHWP